MHRSLKTGLESTAFSLEMKKRQWFHRNELKLGNRPVNMVTIDLIRPINGVQRETEA